MGSLNKQKTVRNDSDVISSDTEKISFGFSFILFIFLVMNKILCRKFLGSLEMKNKSGHRDHVTDFSREKLAAKNEFIKDEGDSMQLISGVISLFVRQQLNFSMSLMSHEY